MKTLPIVLATLLTSSIVATADAAAPVEPRQQVVSFADLNLDHDAGAEKLYRRIASAAREICWTGGVMERVMATRMRRCVEQATAQAVAEVNAPLLSRYHATRSNAAFWESVIALSPHE